MFINHLGSLETQKYKNVHEARKLVLGGISVP